MITTQKWQQLEQRMETLGLHEPDIVEKFILGSGRGGQKIQKTASCVYLKHEPSGIEVKCQESRSREDNRFYARRRLCDKYEEQVLQIETKKQQEIEKIRRQKKRRSRRTKQKMLDEKHHRAKLKKLRKPPPTEDEE